MSKSAIKTVWKTGYKTVWLAVLASVLGSAALAQDGHITFSPDQMQWQPGPGSLPDGAEFVVLEGNPSETGPLTLRIRFPTNYEIPPHYHQALEHVTVLSGTFHVGMGETLDHSQGMALSVGSFVVIPVSAPHFAWTGDEAVEIQLHSNGPFASTYVNPEDDPRNAEASRRQQAAAPTPEEEMRLLKREYHEFLLAREQDARRVVLKPGGN